ncbi:ABC-type spermidine/putrescine transport system, ATPase component [Gottschalkia purinilytica]|uniref:ABC-type quaternary amine transporter n=1 Tax=Gottschalkia purinilytica TaxID=1503 RepID=A0A0L0W6T0_GOTPU|nr:ABC transporter ATP-binding protein [Gottschalkia purinilytica]KNF07258.1 ABC-type spermidine/putrescine transport system, ATPase component [Gottschalkia purinilytica]
MSKVELKNIVKLFDNKKILDNVNLTVEEGELVSLLGPSGCGKTTTLKIISGLLDTDEGDVLVNGKSILNTPVEQRNITIVFQDYLLFPHLNVEENIGFGLKMRKIDKKQISLKTKEMLELVRLSRFEKKKISELSGGQKQRIALARALAVEPKVLLLDEPFSNLDMRLREDMRLFILDIQKRLKITTILVTHDKEEALMMSDKIAIMLDGKINQFGSPTELYEKPVSPEVANFFGDKNYIDGVVKNGIFKSSIFTAEMSLDKCCEGKLMIKPEDVNIKKREGISNIIGTINTKRYAGDRLYYTVIVDDTELKCISNSNIHFSEGDEVEVCIDFDKAIFYEA